MSCPRLRETVRQQELASMRRETGPHLCAWAYECLDGGGIDDYAQCDRVTARRTG